VPAPPAPLPQAKSTTLTTVALGLQIFYRLFMTAFVWRRSLFALSVLSGLLVLAGGLVTVLTPVPFTVPLIVCLLWAGLQYVFAPALIQWLIPAREIRQVNGRYDTNHILGRIVERRCLAADVPLVRLGVVNDGTPNAFTFGRTRRDARIWVSQGILDRLDERELEAVIAHEVAHVANRDFIVMTVASVVPMILYYVYVGARGNNRADGIVVAVSAFLGYLIVELAVLALGRARELGADHASCAVTEDGDALCSALIKVAFGIGQVERERQAEVRDLQDNKDRKAARKLEREGHRISAVSALGIAGTTGNDAIVDAYASGLSRDDAIAAMRWDAVNPWGRFSEKMATHPLVLHRIAALETSGLPGAPREWHVADALRTVRDDQLRMAHRRFCLELPIRYAGWIALVLAIVVAKTGGGVQLAGELVLAAGVVLTVRAMMRTPTADFAPVARITSLLDRLDASPVTGIAVSIRGRVIGRDTPGYVLSPDLVVQDDSGYVPIVYSNSIPFARSIFALLGAGHFADQEVVVRGWYRRDTGPYVELRDVRAANGDKARGNQYLFNYLLGLACAAVGALIVLATLSGN
jgi:Zn-dependent protease with chaperone function